MTRESKTKLLKIVCKRAELMRAPYRGSSWTSQTKQKDQKSLSVNKTKEKLRSIKSNPTNDGENRTSHAEGIDRCQTNSNNANDVPMGEPI